MNIDPLQFTKTENQVSELLIGDKSAEAMMVQVQMLLAKEFDDQIQDISQKIKFLNDVKKSYRENTNVLHELTSQNPITEKSGKRWVQASPLQMHEMVSALMEYPPDLETKTVREKPMTNWGEFFPVRDILGNHLKQSEMAAKIQDKSVERPFYWKYGERFSDGSPKISVLVDALDKMLEQIRNYMLDVEEDTEQLSVQLNQLTSQRKSILEGASQIIRKMEEVATNTVSKI